MIYLRSSLYKVAELSAQAFTNKEISKRVGINEKSIENYIMEIYDKCDLGPSRIINNRTMLSIMFHQGDIKEKQ